MKIESGIPTPGILVPTQVLWTQDDVSRHQLFVLLHILALAYQLLPIAPAVPPVLALGSVLLGECSATNLWINDRQGIIIDSHQEQFEKTASISTDLVKLDSFFQYSPISSTESNLY